MQKLTQMNFKISSTTTKKKKLMYNVLKHGFTMIYTEMWITCIL